MNGWDVFTVIAFVLFVGAWLRLWSIQSPGKALPSADAQKFGSEMIRGALEAGIIGVSFLLPLAIGALTQGKAAIDHRAYLHFKSAILLLCISLLIGIVNIFRLPTAALKTDITKDRATGVYMAAQFFAVFLAILRVFVGAWYL